MFNHIDWVAFNDVWDLFREFMDKVMAWLMYVLADGPKPVE